MRPLKLELQYFGPYEHETIDFTQFREQSLFLVAGNTGAGKTTIFDAMCYALFGQTTSERNRSAAALRSDFAPADQETRVTFTFIHQGTSYQIMRRPKQTLQGRRGSLVEHNQAVDLRYPLGSENINEITKIKEAGNFIVRLLNLTRDQFKQIVLLPQGKFRQFLDSDSNTKEQLLRDLFNTRRYEQWTQALKEELGKQKKTLTTQQTKLQSLKESITDVEAVPDTAEWVQQAAAKVADLEETLREEDSQEQQYQEKVRHLVTQLHTEQELQTNLAALTELKQAAVRLAGQKEEMAAVQHRIADVEWFQKQQTKYQRWRDGEHRLAQLEEDYQQATTQLAQLVKQQGQLRMQDEQSELRQSSITQLQQRITTLQGQLPLFAECDRLTETVAKITADYEKRQSEQAKCQKRIKANQAQLEALTTRLAEQGNLSAQRLKLTQRQGQFEQITSEGKRLQQQLGELAEQNKRCDKLTPQLASSKAAAAEASAQLTELNDRYARQQIARLAKQLKPGTACPVCGSLDHPHLAEAAGADQVVTDAEVKNAAQRARKREQRVVRLQEQLAETKRRLAEGAEQTAATKTELSSLLAVDILPENWQHVLVEREKQLEHDDRELTTIEKAVGEWQDQVKELQPQISADQAAAHQADSEIQRLHQQLIEQRAVLREKQAQLPANLATRQAAAEQLADWQKRVTDFERQRREVQDRLQTIERQVGLAQGRTAQLEHDTVELRKTQEKLHVTLLDLLAQRDSRLDWDFWQQAAGQLADLPSLRQQLKDFQTQCRDNEGQQQRLRQQIAGRTAPDLAASQKKLAAAEQLAAQQQQAIGRLKNRLAALKADQQKVSKLWSKTTEAEGQVNQLQTLTDVIAGNTENHLSLERYVLQAYFQDVLLAANVQLARLTNSRYQFELSTENHGAGAKWSGLEVNVYDDNAGKTRSARTLSGGESFMASLALALALCQIIQEQSGGISIDALFIDEGFGSLDQQALTDALQALQELDGHRMIGIISHVTELEEQVPDQLLVRSVNGRSTVVYQHKL